MKNNWKEEFKALFNSYGEDERYADLFYDFIESLLAEQKKELLDLVEKEVEKMVVNTPNEVVLLNKELPSTLQTNYYNQAVGYVDAVEDISTIINNLRV